MNIAQRVAVELGIRFHAINFERPQLGATLAERLRGLGLQLQQRIQAPHRIRRRRQRPQTRQPRANAVIRERGK